MRPEPLLPRRVVVLGNTGSGKTTLAREIAAIIGARHVELDALYWEPNWTHSEIDVFRERIRGAIGSERWVTDGGYARHVWDITWQSADTIIWLDYPWRISFSRVFRRTMRRMRSQEELWNGNRESFRLTFLNKESLLLWSIRNRAKYRTTYPEYFAKPELSRATVLRMRHPRETGGYLQQLRDLAQQNVNVP